MISNLLIIVAIALAFGIVPACIEAWRAHRTEDTEADWRDEL